MLSDFLLIFIVLGPGLAALIGGLSKPLTGRDGLAMIVTTGTVGLAGILSLIQLFGYVAGLGHGGDHGDAAHHGAHIIYLMNWVDVGGFKADWAIRVDAMSMVMMAVITSVSGLVHLYSWGYMADDPHRARFFTYLSLFTFTMLMLVVADNFLQLFFGWEGVGLASYLLIGFWYQKPAPNDAAIKAFVTNRVGDFGLALGIMGVFFLFGSIEFEPVLNAIRENAMVTPFAFAEAGPAREVSIEFLGYDVRALELIGVLLFIGAMGKSAQLFLHVWLPDAMEGPTPVSALIHAATMVTAGVYLVCLVSPIYEYAPGAAAMVTVVGALTALFAATVGMAQNDIKRVIAYSTCSQLGYMFFAAGVGAYEAAMFHLFTHAFFKALLFLGAGSVIHGNHHEQDMRKLGGVWRYQKFTYGAMLIGTIAIIGLGIPHTSFGFAGFFSKDGIIESAFSASQQGVPFASMAFWAGIGAALLTSFYSWRLIYMTFHGPRAEAEASHGHTDNHAHDDHSHDDHAHDDHNHGGEPHESPLVMLIPLALLSVGAIFAGLYFYDPMFHHGDAFWAGALYHAADNNVIHGIDDLKHDHAFAWVFWAPLVVTVIGFLIATFTYFFNRGFGKRIADARGPTHQLFENKWYFDEIYEATIVRLTRWLGDVFWKIGDVKLINGLGPDGVSNLTKWGSRRISAMHTGYLFHYAFVIIGAALLFGGILFVKNGGVG
jgi:NADH-quinone oxidoreductase subunit L